MAEQVFQKDGEYTVLWSPKGEKFLMPRGGDVNVYLRKGYTGTEPAKKDKGQRTKDKGDGKTGEGADAGGKD